MMLALRPLARLALRPAPLLGPALLVQQRTFSVVHARRDASAPSAPEPPAPMKHAIGRINRRLQITFTCTADVPILKGTVVLVDEEQETRPCSHRSTHEFSRVSYEKGIVLIECPGCKNRHLIADNLQWFADTPSPSHPHGLPLGTAKYHRTVEDLMKEKGEKVTWVEGGPMGGTWTVEG